jgi:histidinol phosphatase-like PHP family hydrolase
VKRLLTNAEIAELLCVEAESAATDRAERLFLDAAHKALMWENEAADIAAVGRHLTELPGVGSSVAKRILGWLETRPPLNPPTTRREFLTLTGARRILAKNPKWAKQLKGDLQMHTVWSDGSGSISEMTAAAVDRGYRYVAITDHTQGLTIANGLDVTRLAEQGREIDVLNRQLKKLKVDFTVLRSAEMNLNPAGEGDMPAKAIQKLDIVLGCFHSSLRKKEDQTHRYLAGLRNPSIQILGHPQTRVYNRRDGLQADWARVFGEAAKLDKAVEIDSYADRQDLRVSLLKIGRKEGCRISLGTDAHHPWQLAFMELGLAAAILAKIPAERIINFLPVEKLKAWVESVRCRKGRK